MPAGHSGKSLAQKMGIKPGDRVFAVAAPKNYKSLLGALPDGAGIVTRTPKEGAEIVHLFVTTRAQLETELPRARRSAATNGAIWVSWYKKSSKMPTDVTENAIRDLALSTTDLVDVKIAAVDEIWSGLKFVVRKHLR